MKKWKHKPWTPSVLCGKNLRNPRIIKNNACSCKCSGALWLRSDAGQNNGRHGRSIESCHHRCICKRLLLTSKLDQKKVSTITGRRPVRSRLSWSYPQAGKICWPIRKRVSGRWGEKARVLFFNLKTGPLNEPVRPSGCRKGTESSIIQISRKEDPPWRPIQVHSERHCG